MSLWYTGNIFKFERALKASHSMLKFELRHKNTDMSKSTDFIGQPILSGY